MNVIALLKKYAELQQNSYRSGLDTRPCDQEFLYPPRFSKRIRLRVHAKYLHTDAKRH